nr:hypothetical protein CFP56_07363 [Quercus suber]
MTVFLGHGHIVKELVDQMTVEHLKITDRLGYTALAETTLIGNKQMAECMLRKHMDLISTTTKWGLLPVVLAVFHRKIEFARYLYQHTRLPSLQEKDGYNGGILIIQAIYTRQFGRDPSLAFALDRDESSPLSVLASMRCAFKSTDPLVFWKEWIYERK